jgi:pimeloyl-ACP methyl ester carboxylesterase
MPIAEINHQGLYYEDSGGEGPAVVFMHGFLFDQTMFDPQVAALAPKYRCIRFDARAFGQTVWDGQPFTLYDTAADAIGLLDHLGIQKATFVGMSQGGYAAMRIALKYPDRVQALVFMSTYYGVDTEDVKEIYRSMRNTWRDVGPAPLLDTYLMLFLGNDEDLRAHWGPKWAAANPHNIWHAKNNLIDRDELSDEQMRTITAPALVIHGMEDQGIPIMLGEQLHNILPNAKGMVRVPEAAHAANLMQPEVVNVALLAFLERYVPVSA